MMLSGQSVGPLFPPASVVPRCSYYLQCASDWAPSQDICPDPPLLEHQMLSVIQILQLVGTTWGSGL